MELVPNYANKLKFRKMKLQKERKAMENNKIDKEKLEFELYFQEFI